MCQTISRKYVRLIYLVALSWLLYCASASATGLGYSPRPSTSIGPPYPAPPIIFDVFHKPLSGPATPLHELSVQMFDAVGSTAAGDDTPLPLLIVAEDVVGDDPGPLGVINILGATTPDDTFPAESRYDVFFDVDGSSSILDAGIRRVDDISFDVFFDVEVNSNALHVASFQFPEQELLIFITPEIMSNDSGIHVQFGVRRTDGIPAQPLFSIALHGHFIPEPSTLVLTTLALLNLLAHGRRRRKA